MSIQTIYAALNGMEIRKIVKDRLILEIDKLPLLKIGNTFHRAEIEFGFVMTAYPADVPVPQKELEFHLVDESLEPEWNAHVLKLEELAATEKRLLRKQDELVGILEIINQAKLNLVVETEVLDKIDAGNSPDETRANHGLDIQVAERKGGQVVENPKSPKLLFNKEIV